jgi:predicted AlkP superfamily phosphohydrolase/phosphomutase
MVLAIALDAADGPLVRELLDRGELPALARIERQGNWGAIRSPARIGSGAPWPTFFTGTPLEQHQVHATWRWDPSAMRPLSQDPFRLQPFWESADGGGTVGVLDVPCARPAGLKHGFEVTEWGVHDPVTGRTGVAPAELAPEVAEPHPFSRLQDDSADRPMDTEALVSGCMTGAAQRSQLAQRLIERQRPDLAVVVFTEIHHSSHELWHTIEPEHPLYEGLSGEPRSLLEVYREVDRQMGLLVEAVAPETPVVVFSLHGMRPGRGLVQALHPILTALGYTAAPPARARTPAEHAKSVFGSLKRHTPAPLKRAYHRRMPVEMRLRVARPTMMAPVDWSRTRAFGLASADQHGDIRVNLRGREAKGIVAPEDYEAVREELAGKLAALEREDGEPLVSEVVRVGDGSPPPVLPDLIVHWSDAAFVDPLRVGRLGVVAKPTVMRITGQHRAEGFFVARGFGPAPPPSLDPVELKELLLSRTPA